MTDISTLAGGELVQHLNLLTQQKSELRQEYQKAIKIASDASVNAKQIKIKITQVADDIASCKFAIKSEQS